ncbi:MAG: hypothetical protein ACR2LN_03385 [Candidatus Levyibacteriota bacterium]
MKQQATIFADQDNKVENPTERVQNKDSVSLSRDEYKEIIKEAYKEGAKEATQKNDKDQEPPPQQQDDTSVNETYVEKKSHHEKEGRKEAVKSEAQKMEENKQRVKAITERQDIQLLRVKTRFPYNLFPDTIIIDTTKVTISKKQFFWTESITTIPLKDLSDVTVQTALFVASISIKYMPQASSPGMLEPVVESVTSLRREDAIRAKNILKGALVAKAEEIDIAKLSPDEVKTVIEKFGQNDGIE